MWCAEGSIGLALVGGVAVKGGDLVDTLDIVKYEARRASKDVKGEFVSLLSCCLSIFLRGLEREGW